MFLNLSYTKREHSYGECFEREIKATDLPYGGDCARSDSSAPFAGSGYSVWHDTDTEPACRTDQGTRTTAGKAGSRGSSACSDSATEPACDSSAATATDADADAGRYAGTAESGEHTAGQHGPSGIAGSHQSTGTTDQGPRIQRRVVRARDSRQEAGSLR